MHIASVYLYSVRKSISPYKNLFHLPIIKIMFLVVPFFCQLCALHSTFTFQ